MRTQARRILSLMIAVLILLSGCSPAPKPPSSDVPAVVPENPGPGVPVDTDAPDHEREYVGQIMGGIFYTLNSSDPQDSGYTEMRKTSVRLLRESILSVVADASVVSSALEQYRNLLLESLDKVASSSADTIFEITQGILVYDIAISSCAAQIDSILLTDPQDDVNKAALDMHLLGTVSQLVNDQQDYLSWLMGSTEAVFALLEKTNPDRASEFLESAVIIFSGDIAEPFRQLLKGYHRTAEIYAYILSADYHFSEYHMQQIQKRLGLLDPQRKESLAEIIDVYNEILQAPRRFPVIMDIPEDEVVSGQAPQMKTVLLSYSMSPVAESDYDRYYTSAIAMSLLVDLQLRVIDREWNLSDVERAREIENLFLEDLLLDTNVTKNIRASYEDSRALQGDDDMNRTARRRILQTIQSEVVPDQAVLEEVSRIEEQVASMERASSPRLDRQSVIDRISLGQRSLDLYALLTDDAGYSMMIGMINNILADGNSSGLDNARIKNISNLVNNDLQEMLGDQKVDFMRRITTVRAEELLDIFDDWKRNTANFNEFNFSKDDLVRLVSALDMDVAADQEAVGPLPSAVRGFWELIRTESVIPQEYQSGDDKDNRRYTFEYADGSIGCKYTRVAYDGIKKVYLTELIDTSGGWSVALDDGAYLPNEKVKLTLNASIDHFQRLTPVESGGGGTNQSGVAVWAYIGNITTPFGNATAGVLESVDGDSVCRATISEGKIILSSATLEVSGVFGPGKDKEQKVLFVVVSNQGRIGGVKYIYEYLE